jgi:hypothetical protein
LKWHLEKKGFRDVDFEVIWDILWCFGYVRVKVSGTAKITVS